MKWIRDEEFIRGDIPMTKFEARILTIAMLEIKKGDKLIDVGAGTGSISIEAVLHGAEVTSIEREDEGIFLIEENKKKFNVPLKIVKGSAPLVLEGISGYNKCFIGGSGGRLNDIFKEVNKGLINDGIICGNFITLKNLNDFSRLLNDYRYSDIEIRMIQASRVDKRTSILKANNPVFIVRGRKV